MKLKEAICGVTIVHDGGSGYNILILTLYLRNQQVFNKI